jgi:translation initiation factor IF-2
MEEKKMSKKRSHRQSALSGPGTALPEFIKLTEEGRRRIEVVLKCDMNGSVEAVSSILTRISNPDVEIRMIHSGVGPVSKSDLVMALTGSKLVVGFNVGVMPKLEQWIKDHGIEVRIYNVIYKIAEDMKAIAQSLILTEEEEMVNGKGKVIELFKSSHGGIIMGCEVLDGALTLGCKFRVISAIGPVYNGKIDSLHIENRGVKEAKPGQQVGIKIDGFKGVKLGDLVECYEIEPPKKNTGWRPSGTILHMES